MARARAVSTTHTRSRSRARTVCERISGGTGRKRASAARAMRSAAHCAPLMRAARMAFTARAGEQSGRMADSRARGVPYAVDASGSKRMACSSRRSGVAMAPAPNAASHAVAAVPSKAANCVRCHALGGTASRSARDARRTARSAIAAASIGRCAASSRCTSRSAAAASSGASSVARTSAARAASARRSSVYACARLVSASAHDGSWCTPSASRLAAVRTQSSPPAHMRAVTGGASDAAALATIARERRASMRAARATRRRTR